MAKKLKLRQNTRPRNGQMGLPNHGVPNQQNPGGVPFKRHRPSAQPPPMMGPNRKVSAAPNLGTGMGSGLLPKPQSSPIVSNPTMADASAPPASGGDTMPTYDEWGRAPGDPRFGMDPNSPGNVVTGKQGGMHFLNATKKSGVPFGFHKDADGNIVPNAGAQYYSSSGQGTNTPAPAGGGSTPPPAAGATAPQGYGAYNGQGSFTPAGVGTPGFQAQGLGKVWKGLQSQPFWQNLNPQQQKAIWQYFAHNAGGGGFDATLSELTSASMAPETLYKISQQAGLDPSKLLADIQPTINGGSLPPAYMNTPGNVAPTLQGWQQDPKYLQALLNYMGPNSGAIQWSQLEQMFPGQDFGGPPGNMYSNAPEGSILGQFAGGPGAIPGMENFQFAPWAGQFYPPQSLQQLAYGSLY